MRPVSGNDALIDEMMSCSLSGWKSSFLYIHMNPVDPVFGLDRRPSAHDRYQLKCNTT